MDTHRIGIPIAALVLALTGCSGDDDPSQLTADDYGDEWPFTVEEVSLVCEGGADRPRVYVEADGQRYALNGFARSESPDLPDTGEITRENPEIDGAKMDAGVVLEAGVALC